MVHGRLDITRDDAFERKLFVIRKVMERTLRESDLTQRKMFYVSSLSCRTIVYHAASSAGNNPSAPG